MKGKIRINNFTHKLQDLMYRREIENYAELSRKAHVNSTIISELLSGSKISLSDLNKICMVLGVPNDYFKLYLTENTYFTINEFGKNVGEWDKIGGAVDIKETSSPILEEEKTIVQKQPRKKLTEEEKKERAKVQRQKYYREHKEEMMEKQRQRREKQRKLKTDKKKADKTYYETHREEILRKKRELYQMGKIALMNQAKAEEASKSSNKEPVKKGFFAKLFGGK